MHIFYNKRRKAFEETGEIRCAMGHVLAAERRGEINHDNVLYVIENINVAGKIHEVFELIISTQID